MNLGHRYACHVSITGMIRHTSFNLTGFMIRSGFLYAYIVFIAADVCLLLITPKQTPEQFHHCQTAKARIEEQVTSSKVLETVMDALKNKDQQMPGSFVRIAKAQGY